RPGGPFVMSAARPWPSPVVLARALAGRLALMRRYGSTWRTVGSGLRLLLRGRLRDFLGKLREGLRGPAFDAPDEEEARRAYVEWMCRRALTHRDRQEQRAAGRLPDAPLLSVVLAVSDEEERFVRPCIESVLRQTYGKWELCVALVAPAGRVGQVLSG